MCLTMMHLLLRAGRHDAWLRLRIVWAGSSAGPGGRASLLWKYYAAPEHMARDLTSATRFRSVTGAVSSGAKQGIQNLQRGQRGLIVLILFSMPCRD